MTDWQEAGDRIPPGNLEWVIVSAVALLCLVAIGIFGAALLGAN